MSATREVDITHDWHTRAHLGSDVGNLLSRQDPAGLCAFTLSALHHPVTPMWSPSCGQAHVPSLGNVVGYLILSERVIMAMLAQVYIDIASVLLYGSLPTSPSFMSTFSVCVCFAVFRLALALMAKRNIWRGRRTPLETPYLLVQRDKFISWCSRKRVCEGRALKVSGEGPSLFLPPLQRLSPRLAHSRTSGSAYSLFASAGGF